MTAECVMTFLMTYAKETFLLN